MLCIILLTYYTTVVCVYGKIALSGVGGDARLATAVVVVYNLLVRRLVEERRCFALAVTFPRQIFMLLWSYFAAVLTEPGRVPPGWQPAEFDEEACVHPLSHFPSCLTRRGALLARR